MDQWRKKPVRYWSRIEIEEIVKELNIDRNRFYEYSKSEFRKVINGFYYSFVEHKNIPLQTLSYCWINFRKDLKETGVVSENIGWIKMLWYC